MTRPPIALIGLPTDSNSSHLRGAAKAPDRIREALFSPMGNAAAENGMELGAEIGLRDQGDVDLTETPEDDARIEAAITAALDQRAVPIALGGDHSVTHPILRAVAARHGPVDILHFDAHPDLYDELDGNRRSHACPFARIMEQGLARRLVQVGIRTLNRHQREQARRFRVEIVEMRHFSVEAVPVLTGPLYVSIDLDGLDPSVAPGVSHHEPGGLIVRDILRVLERQTSGLTGADVVELNPDRDVNGMTAVVAAKLVKELCAYAVGRAGRASAARNS